MNKNLKNPGTEIKKSSNFDSLIICEEGVIQGNKMPSSHVESTVDFETGETEATMTVNSPEG